MNREPRILLSWEINPGYAPPMRFSSHQVTACRTAKVLMPFFPSEDAKVDIWTPPGAYDLYAEVSRHFGDCRFDLVIVWSSSARSYRGLYNVPQNTKQFGCPTILIAGDTHHMQRPIHEMVQYAEQERFDYVASIYDRQHLHWFGAKGIEKVAWFPGASVTTVKTEEYHQRIDAACLFGHNGAHPVRKAILDRLQNEAIPLVLGTRTRSSAADEYAKNLISLNCSLNGDLNLRNFEVLSAGGFLLTDRLSKFSGFDQIIRPGIDCEVYENAEDLLQKIQFYRRYPEAAFRISRAGKEWFNKELEPQTKKRQILDWVLDDKLPGYLDPTAEARFKISKDSTVHLDTRIAIYETVQEIHRTRQLPRVYLKRGANPIYSLDLADLPRLQIAASRDDLKLRTFTEKLGLTSKVEWINDDIARQKRWDFIVEADRPSHVN